MWRSTTLVVALDFRGGGCGVYGSGVIVLHPPSLRRPLGKLNESRFAECVTLVTGPVPVPGFRPDRRQTNRMVRLRGWGRTSPKVLVGITGLTACYGTTSRDSVKTGAMTPGVSAGDSDVSLVRSGPVRRRKRNFTLLFIRKSRQVDPSFALIRFLPRLPGKPPRRGPFGPQSATGGSGPSGVWTSTPKVYLTPVYRGRDPESKGSGLYPSVSFRGLIYSRKSESSHRLFEVQLSFFTYVMSCSVSTG